MILTNYRKPNFYKSLIESFSDENSYLSFGVVKSSSTLKYRWVADYLFKHKNNTQTNTHRAFISFFSNKDDALIYYGNILELQQEFPNYLDGVQKTKIPEFSYELASNQYRVIGQEYTEFDIIEYIDASDRLYANSSLFCLIIGDIITINNQTKNVVEINHVYGDAPVFVSSGYKFYNFTTGNNKLIWDNPPESVDINFNNFKIIFNDDQKDLYTHKQFLEYIENTSTPLTSGTILMDIEGSNGLLSEESLLNGSGTKT